MKCEICGEEMNFIGYDQSVPPDKIGKPLYAIYECPKCGYEDDFFVEYF